MTWYSAVPQLLCLCVASRNGTYHGRPCVISVAPKTLKFEDSGQPVTVWLWRCSLIDNECVYHALFLHMLSWIWWCWFSQEFFMMSVPSAASCVQFRKNVCFRICDILHSFTANKMYISKFPVLYIFSLLKQHITTGGNLKIIFLIFFVCFKYYLYYMVHLLHKILSPIFQNLEPHTSLFPDATHSFSLVPYSGILTVLFLYPLHFKWG